MGKGTALRASPLVGAFRFPCSAWRNPKVRSLRLSKNKHASQRGALPPVSWEASSGAGLLNQGSFWVHNSFPAASSSTQCISPSRGPISESVRTSRPHRLRLENLGTASYRPCDFWQSHSISLHLHYWSVKWNEEDMKAGLRDKACQCLSMEHSQGKVMTIMLVLRLCWNVCSKFLNVKVYLAHVWSTYMNETGKIKVRRGGWPQSHHSLSLYNAPAQGIKCWCVIS